AGAARFANRSCNLRMNVAVAKEPSATVGSPRSNRQSVSRRTKRRAAISLVEMPRLRRASARSRPNLRSAWAAGNGIEPVFDMALLSGMADGQLKSYLSDGMFVAGRGSQSPRQEPCARAIWSGKALELAGLLRIQHGKVGQVP